MFSRSRSIAEHDLKVGDSVLFKNPSRKRGLTQDPFVPVNIIGEVEEMTPGGMCRVSYGENSLYVKNVFVGQLVKWKTNDTPQSNHGPGEPDIESEQVYDRKSVLDHITIFSESLRSDFYASKLRLKLGKEYPISKMINLALDTYDHGVTAKLYGQIDNDKSVEHQLKFEAQLEILKKNRFPFFLYSTVHWERSRKINLGPVLNQFLNEFINDEHSCMDCFNSDTSCDHECCKKRAVSFAIRCGLLRLTKANDPPKQLTAVCRSMKLESFNV